MPYFALPSIAHSFAQLRKSAQIALQLCCIAILLPISLFAQSSTATLSGTIADASGALVPNVSVTITNEDTNASVQTQSNRAGIYNVPGLNPGHYRILVEKQGFKQVDVRNLTLNVQDIVSRNFALQVGGTSETVQVDGSGVNINTTDGSVSTVIDRKFVENTPLNGRSFQSLILATPGTETNTPQRSSANGNTGEFSVNGQRTESNYYTVDGVSAITGTSAGVNGAGASGALPTSTALGTTQALVSVDALQEFRVQSSTYSAEYGRSPGGQFSMATRSGTNEFHGTIFDYFRNDALDANSWFNDNTTPPTRKTPERQNDFGGTVGGPVLIPHFYDGRNRSFFFVSYEGLRLVQPVGATINAVPSLQTRQSANGALQQALNAFPLPTPNTPDLGQGLSEFVGGWSTPSKVDATSVRLDHNIGQRTHLFFRFSNTPSDGQTRGTSVADSTPSALTSSNYLARGYTFGATQHIARDFDDDLRVSFGSSTVLSHTNEDNFGGAVPVDLGQLQGLGSTATTILGLSFGSYSPGLTQSTYGARQHQWNVVDTLSFVQGKHTLKAGIDWRELSSAIQQTNPYTIYYFTSLTSLANNSVDIGAGQSDAPVYPVYKNFSAFAQDEWRATSRLNLSLGLRWEVNPAPGVSRGLMPYTFIGLDDLSTLSLAPQGTSLWKTTWYNFAPRLGFAYQLGVKPEFATILRGGGGVFFDTGQQTGSYAFEGPGFSVTNYFGTDYQIAASFPVSPALLAPTIIQPPKPIYASAFANPVHMQLPYTFQWNTSLEQSLGRSQSLSISYVGSNGRKLLEESEANIAKYNPDFTYLYVFKNGLTSSYNALQVKYQRQVAHGLQALVSYTWSHNLDYGSYNAAVPYQRGNSDQDLRHNATAAISYDIPHTNGSSLLRILSSNWGIDGRFTVRTGFPVTLNGNSVTDPTTGQLYFGGLNIVPNTPFFLHGPRSQFPGGRRINQAAFKLPPTGVSGNAPRNFISGFGAGEADVAFRRSFPIFEGLHGQFRAEAFNISNHPNFGAVNATFGNIQFGEATAILAQSLGTLSPLYQMGGPRSLQLAFRLTY